MSPTILRELMRVKRGLNSWTEVTVFRGEVIPMPDDASWFVGCAGVSREAVARRDVLLCFLAELPYRRYCEESDREHEAFVAAGNRSVCEHCGERAVKHDVACTLGYPGHPGAEFSAFYKCEACGKVDM